MRFHQLVLENITSLRGPHKIDFDAIGRVDDLFAITGVTGSGKSSILTAIMLALYGETPKGLNQNDIVSLGEKKAKIELLFSLKGKKYWAYWENKSKGRRFLTESGENLPLDFLPLSFEQFCKTIILNQGEFSKFLTSTFAQRKEILEKLYGETSLSELSPKLNSLIKDKKQSLNALLEQEQIVLPFKEEEVSLWKNELESLSLELHEVKIKREAFKEISKELKDLLSYRTKKAELEKKEQGLLLELKRQTDLFNLDQEKERLSQNALTQEEGAWTKKRPLWLELIQKESKKENLQKSLHDKEKNIHDLALRYKEQLAFSEKEGLHLKDKEAALQKLETLLLDFSSKQSGQYEEQKEALEKARHIRRDDLKVLELTHKKIEELTKEELRLKEDFLHAEERLKALPPSDGLTQTHKILLENIRLYFKNLGAKEGLCPVCHQALPKEGTGGPSLEDILTQSLQIEEETLLNHKAQAKEEERLKHLLAQLTKLSEEITKAKSIIQTLKSELELKKEDERLGAELQSLEDQHKKFLTSLKEKEGLERLILEIKKNQRQRAELLERLKKEGLEAKAQKESYTQQIQLLEEELGRELPAGQTASLLLKKAEENLSLLRRKKEEASAELQASAKQKHGLEIQIKGTREQIEDLVLHLTKLWAKLKGRLEEHKEKFYRFPEKALHAEHISEIENWDVLEIFLEQELIYKLEQFTSDIETKTQALEEKRAKVQLFEQKKEQQKIIQEKIEKEKAEVLRWSNLFDLIGNDEFRNFTLGLIEKELIHFTNQELLSLCQGRFALIQNEAKRGNDFSVIDRWKGGEARKVSTLSGGETFLVSLAMAMALSEMSRGTASVESFFIDEGFGTLDEDSLSEVLETLSNLKGRGKVVGIISHVKALTERIAVNVFVKKSSNGDSQIELIYN